MRTTCLQCRHSTILSVTPFCPTDFGVGRSIGWLPYQATSSFRPLERVENCVDCCFSWQRSHWPCQEWWCFWETCTMITLSDTHLRAVEGGREYSTTIPALPESWGTWPTWTHWLTVVSGQYLGVSFYISMQCWDTSPNEWKYGILFAAEEVVRAGVLSFTLHRLDTFCWFGVGCVVWGGCLVCFVCFLFFFCAQSVRPRYQSMTSIAYLHDCHCCHNERSIVQKKNLRDLHYEPAYTRVLCYQWNSRRHCQRC